MKNITKGILRFLMYLAPLTLFSQPYSVTYTPPSGWWSYGGADLTCEPCNGKQLSVQMQTINFVDYYIGLRLTHNGNLISSFQYPASSSTTSYVMDSNHEIKVEPIINGTVCDGYILAFPAKVGSSNYIETHIIKFDPNLNIVWRNSPFTNSSNLDLFHDFLLESNSGVLLTSNSVGSIVSRFDLTTGNILNSKEILLVEPGLTSSQARSIVKLNSLSSTFPGDYAITGVTKTSLGHHRTFLSFLSNSFTVTDQYTYDFNLPNVTYNEGLHVLEKSGAIYISGHLAFNGGSYYPYLLSVNGTIGIVPIGTVFSNHYYDISSAGTGYYVLQEMAHSPTGNGILIAGNTVYTGSHGEFISELDFSGGVNWSKRYTEPNYLFSLKTTNSEMCACGINTTSNFTNIRTNSVGDINQNCNSNSNDVPTSIPTNIYSLNFSESIYQFGNQNNTLTTSSLSLTQMGCSEITIISSTNDDQLSSLMSIAPNPIEDYLFIQNKTNNKIINLSIYNMSGAMVYQVKNPEDSIDLSSILPGIYVIKIRTQTKTIIKKVVIH